MKKYIDMVNQNFVNKFMQNYGKQIGITEGRVIGKADGGYTYFFSDNIAEWKYITFTDFEAKIYANGEIQERLNALWQKQMALVFGKKYLKDLEKIKFGQIKQESKTKLYNAKKFISGLKSSNINLSVR